MHLIGGALSRRSHGDFMSDILNKNIVLVLNRNWQAINIRTPADAFCQLATNAATALDIALDDEAADCFTSPVTRHPSRLRCAPSPMGRVDHAPSP
jgi:hypothetical protein